MGMVGDLKGVNAEFDVIWEETTRVVHKDYERYRMEGIYTAEDIPGPLLNCKERITNLNQRLEAFKKGEKQLTAYLFRSWWDNPANVLPPYHVRRRPKDMADQLRDYGSFIPGLRPGRRTADYLEKVMERITYCGAAFLAIIAVLPTVVATQRAAHEGDDGIDGEDNERHPEVEIQPPVLSAPLCRNPFEL